MSHTASGEGDGQLESTRAWRVLNWAGHYGDRFVYACAAAVLLFYGLLRVIDSSLLLVGYMGALLLEMIAYFLVLWHPLGWCERCVHQRAPRSAEREAEEKRWQLRLFHFVLDYPWLFLGFKIALLAVGIYGPGLIAPIGFCLWLSAELALVHAVIAHRWNWLSCPQCRDDDDGDDEDPQDTPVPDPDPSAERPAPTARP